MDSILKALGITVLAIVGSVALIYAILIGLILVLAFLTEKEPPERKILLDTTFRGTRVLYEELAKAHVGYTGHQLLLSLNGKYVWGTGEQIEPKFRNTLHFVLPVHPEDLQHVIAIRHLPPIASHSTPPDPSTPFDDISRYVVSTMYGRAMWLSPTDITREEFVLIGDFLEAYRAEQQQPLFYIDALVYADPSFFAPRIYTQKTSKGEREITIALNGEAYYQQDIPTDIPSRFGQSFGQLDSTTKILYVQLAPANAVLPLKLTKEEIEAFTDAKGNPLRARYRVEILPPETQP
ncbi:MAG: hypothetical protein ACK41G_06825 [Candidatus Thermochlorobacter sp.]